MFTKIYDISFEISGESVDLEQDAGCGEVHRIVLHAIHVRLLASEMGLMRGDASAWTLVESLQRKLSVLRDRCEHLGKWLHQHSDTEHADLSYEQTYAEATADLAREFCRELPPFVRDASGPEADKTQRQPSGNRVETHGITQSRPPGLAPESGK